MEDTSSGIRDGVLVYCANSMRWTLVFLHLRRIEEEMPVLVFACLFFHSDIHHQDESGYAQPENFRWNTDTKDCPGAALSMKLEIESIHL